MRPLGKLCCLCCCEFSAELLLTRAAQTYIFLSKVVGRKTENEKSKFIELAHQLQGWKMKMDDIVTAWLKWGLAQHFWSSKKVSKPIHVISAGLGAKCHWKERRGTSAMTVLYAGNWKTCPSVEFIIENGLFCNFHYGSCTVQYMLLVNMCREFGLVTWESVRLERHNRKVVECIYQYLWLVA